MYSWRLAQRGADVTGIDFSGRSIQYAQDTAEKEGLSIRYVNENYLDFETDERFDLIIMIYCDYCALSPAQRVKMLGKFYGVLKSGGCVLLDVYSLEAFKERREQAVYEKNQLCGFWAANDYYGFLNTFKYEEEKVVLDKYTIIEEERTRTVYNWLQYFSPDDLKREFADCGFDIDAVYSDVAGAAFDPQSDEFAIVARRL